MRKIFLSAVFALITTAACNAKEKILSYQSEINVDSKDLIWYRGTRDLAINEWTHDLNHSFSSALTDSRSSGRGGGSSDGGSGGAGGGR